MRPIDQSLAELIGIGEVEMTRRLHALDFSDQDRANLRLLSPHVATRLSEVVERFYEMQLADSATMLVIGDADTLQRLKMSMRYYLMSIFDAIHDVDYVTKRLRIGKVHKRIGVTPHLYIRGLHQLHAVLDGLVGGICAELNLDDDCEGILGSLHKALVFDAQITLEAYVGSHLLEIEATKEEVRRYAARLGVKMDLTLPQMRDTADRDPLTGLPNRRVLLDRLEHELAVAERHRLPLCLAYIDLNRFKEVNDRDGHEAGDKVLQALGRAMRQAARSIDLPARIGGDEFCLVMPRTSEAQACSLLERVAEEFDLRNMRDAVTLSGGVVQAGPEEFPDAAELLRWADGLMYLAKRAARTDRAHHFHLSGGDVRSWPCRRVECLASAPSGQQRVAEERNIVDCP